MNRFILIICFLLFFPFYSFGTTYTGGVSKVGQKELSKVVDSKTGKGVEFAQVSMPQKNFRTYTDSDGNFQLPQIKITQPTILNVEKEGYRPFSVTINNNASLNTPMQVEIAKSESLDIKLDTEILHLGDNSFSQNSANASDFKVKSLGPYYSKDFIVTQNAKQATNYLVIGSIVGLDTKLAKAMGQNKIHTSAYSSPAEVFFNGRKIGELKINGDGQRIKIPKQLIIADAPNQITIKTGKNMVPSSRSGIDYDDIEIMNLSIFSE